jgi:hypothetical protein
MFKINLLTLLKVSLVSLPVSILFYNWTQDFLGNIMGGYAAVAGFPIQYYYDIWGTPEVEFDHPWLNLINYFLYYLGFTIFFYQIYKEIFKKKVPANK